MQILEANWILRTWRPQPHKLLICRPHGGLNDSLVQFSAAIRYAHSTQRQLHLDLSHPDSGVRLNARELFTLPLSRTRRPIRLDNVEQRRFPASWQWFPPETRDLAYESTPSPDGPSTHAGSLRQRPVEW